MVPVGAEILAGLVPGVAEKFVAGISISAAVMRVVVRLKQAVLLDDPGDFGAHIRASEVPALEMIFSAGFSFI